MVPKAWVPYRSFAYRAGSGCAVLRTNLVKLLAHSQRKKNPPLGLIWVPEEAFLAAGPLKLN